MYSNYSRLYEDQKRIIELISSEVPLKETFEFIIYSIELNFGISNLYGSIMLYDRNKHALVDPISPSLPSEYVKMLKTVPVGPYEGSCGTAAFFKQSVIVSNIFNDPLWEKYRHIASLFGLRPCWSLPILSPSKDVLGTFALYSDSIHCPSPNLIEAVQSYAQLAAIAIQMKKMTNLKRSNNITPSSQRNQLFIEQEREYVKLLKQLNRALDQSEFEVYYQPYFGTKKRSMGVEALIRWNHPSSGLLNPASFLGIAEETGFILDIERWVLFQALTQIKALQNQGFPHLTLSVNISAQEFAIPGFPKLVDDLLTSLSFDPKLLTFEVTERALISKENVSVLQQLKELGVKISIDDFGTAYSSLQYLKDLSVDELKIDRSFITNIETNVTNQKIVEMIIMLGHQLNLTVVAEGVETVKQYKMLRAMNCDKVQGFLFSKPIPLNEFEKKYIGDEHRSINLRRWNYL